MPAENVAKYQFNIFEFNGATNNSAATKAVMDCSTLFTANGYQEHVMTFHNNAKRGIAFYSAAFAGICKFLMRVKRGALVGTQYPMLNNVFKYFIMAARLKNVKFFCIIHDIESLRLGGKDKAAAEKEAANLNYYNCLIVHNGVMKQWLINHGVTTKMVPLGIFDYLHTGKPVAGTVADFSKTIVYAGNLGKSRFVYNLAQINNWKFNLYGPNYIAEQAQQNAAWQGVFTPDQVVNELKGDFGLIWDGDRIDKADDILGNYIKYNNPHKFSLYLAAGLPVIAPANSAIAQIIKQYNIGLLINNLYDLDKLTVTAEQYRAFKNNAAKLQQQVIKGNFFTAALKVVEKQLAHQPGFTP